MNITKFGTYNLVQYENNKTYVHGASENISELIAFYYKWRKQLGYMEIVTESDNKVLATLGSKK